MLLLLPHSIKNLTPLKRGWMSEQKAREKGSHAEETKSDTKGTRDKIKRKHLTSNKRERDTRIEDRKEQEKGP